MMLTTSLWLDRVYFYLSFPAVAPQRHTGLTILGSTFAETLVLLEGYGSMTARPHTATWMHRFRGKQSCRSHASRRDARFAHPANPGWDLAVCRKNGILRLYPQLANPCNTGIEEILGVLM